ncbi:MAG: TAXI family TRAP transporter solute-binding subunit [Lentisphaerae bacterium]|nr:TAXI family TRAP transporter solute-binding subunit [Lentisphaerota bacterium]
MKKNTKRIFSLLVVLAVLFSLASCGSPNQGGSDATEASGNFVMGTGGVAGTWYPLGGVMCGAMTAGKLNVTVQASGGGVENVRTVLSGDRDLGMAGGDIAYYGYAGTSDFEGEDGSSLRVLARFSPMQSHLVARANSGINSIADLKGKAVGCGAVGSGDELAIRGFLGTVGLTYDDIDEYLISVAEQATAFKDRKLDVMYLAASAPTSGVLHAASQAECKLVPIAGSEREAILNEFPFFHATVIPKTAYTFLKEDAETVGLDTLLLCTTDLSDEVAYAMLQNLFDNVESVRAAHGSMADFTIESACEGEFAVPLHPGAIKFYQDKGVL